MPLAMHKKAPAAHAASVAAQKQGKFWEMHDLIFANQREISPEKYVEWAQQLGLDMDRFRADYASAEVKAIVDADFKEAQSLGVTGTPAFFVNGRFLSGAKPFEEFATLIDAELKKGG
jgi:protein-disulfide isomerase